MVEKLAGEIDNSMKVCIIRLLYSRSDQTNDMSTGPVPEGQRLNDPDSFLEHCLALACPFLCCSASASLKNRLKNRLRIPS